ncbi:LacI family DNA-binding transcriptional regulator [Bifidobacterium cebidarum]|nr:LacI family DNA-binding transcriptional regulator [Bifidobacterium cebidarum]
MGYENMAKRVTLAEVAARAQVSPKTVSDVIHNRGRMRPETRERIIASMRELGYHANAAARTLRTGISHTIGLALPNFAQPFNGNFADVLTQYAKTKGYRVIIATYYGLDGGLPALIEETYSIGADGWVFLSDSPIPEHRNFLKQSYPVVLTGDYLAHDAVDTVMFPNLEGAKHATSWLLEHGARHVGFIGAPQQLIGRGEDPTVCADIAAAREGNAPLRFKGYVTAMQESGVAIDPALVGICRRLDREDGEAAAEAIIRSGAPLDALCCANDAVALGAMSALANHHIAIPDDVQVIGFDNTPDARFSSPKLTTINPHIEQYAKLSIDLLIDRIEGAASNAAPNVYTTTFDLIQRETTR